MDGSKDFCEEKRNSFLEMKNGCEPSRVKIFFQMTLLGSHYIFEILQTSSTVKNRENKVKSACYERTSFFEMKKEYKVCCVKILVYC